MINVSYNGSTYQIPQEGDEGWADGLTQYFVALASGSLTKAGGSFAISNEIDFGNTAGITVKYIKTKTSGVASAGMVRMAKTDTVAWRNNAGSSDLLLGIDSNDNLTFNGESFGLPPGICLPYFGSGTPVGFIKPYGQAVPRTGDTARLFALFGTTYGAGDGATTFNLPDCRGRAFFAMDNLGGTAAGRVTSAGSGVDGETLGASGGHQLLHTHYHKIDGVEVAGTALSDGAHTHPVSASGTTGGGGAHTPSFTYGSVSFGAGSTFSSVHSMTATGSTKNCNAVPAHTHPVTVSGTASSSGAHTHTVEGTADGFTDDQGSGDSQNMPPAIICNVIMKL